MKQLETFQLHQNQSRPFSSNSNNSYLNTTTINQQNQFNKPTQIKQNLNQLNPIRYNVNSDHINKMNTVNRPITNTNNYQHTNLAKEDLINKINNLLHLEHLSYYFMCHTDYYMGEFIDCY